MDNITISVEKFEELVRKAHSFDLLKSAAKGKSYLSELEKTICELYEEPTEEDDF